MTVRMPAGNYMDHYKVEFLERCDAAAYEAAHLFPEFAACEAALESGFGTSGLAIADHNLFGMKQHQHPVYGTHNLPTREFIHGEWKSEVAHWVKYPTERDCFIDRMATLKRLAPCKDFEHYAAALVANSGEAFVREVSAKWSTDPNRAQKVLNIHREWKG